MILYATLARGPKLSHEGQTNSTRLFMRELDRFGITSVVDAGGGLENYPGDYELVRELDERGELTGRLAYNLFRQKPKEELADFSNWTRMAAPNTINTTARASKGCGTDRAGCEEGASRLKGCRVSQVVRPGKRSLCDSKEVDHE
jgi:predicted amidohydrolase YtcJ